VYVLTAARAFTSFVTGFCAVGLLVIATSFASHGGSAHGTGATAAVSAAVATARGSSRSVLVLRVIKPADEHTTQPPNIKAGRPSTAARTQSAFEEPRWGGPG
jgi:hypothetical protein